tara:strand:- start:1921 stop:2142 length:222 start_codon:yes stop_codon:yes gene_type:complete
MSIEMVDLSNYAEAKIRSNQVEKKNSHTYYLEEYKGLDILTRAKKAALYASDNGRCWWIYDWVYNDLTWRNKK